MGLTVEKRRNFDSLDEKSALEAEIFRMREELRHNGGGRQDRHEEIYLEENREYEREVKSLQNRIHELDEDLTQSHRHLKTEGSIRVQLQNELEIYTQRLEDSLDEIKRLFRENNLLRKQLGEEPHIYGQADADLDLIPQGPRRRSQNYRDSEGKSWGSPPRAQR